MKKILVYILLLILLVSCANNQEKNKTVVDKKGDKILIGYSDRKGLTSEPFNIWFNSEYDKYIVDTLSVNSISKEALKKIKITIIMGTWCGDSRREVPRFYKIIDNLNFDENKITVINVNRKMEAKGIDVQSLEISRIPTFIFCINNKELGRIIETPKKSLEKDLMGIIPIN